MRRPLKKKHEIIPDPVYNSVQVSKFINCLMEEGKKNIARSVVYGAMEKIKADGKDPLETFETALRNVAPSMEVR